ncbi:hypothetical protein R3X27_21675 [Tropicimonas sp. TH_r6]|uniref:hypothetical protein n=1 Tax=Tropicimonas sp. TH_r6 TaxID=3082085 RepID=UPI00295579DC|nr:hypothetical protein [Tropicimonas sp. TH_r6]MDV7145302.1 hypothetical protein [Tropicimonas sp. TH_r6]
MPDSLTLTPLIATALFVLLVLSGRGFRQTWKAQGPNWQRKAWAYGVPALAAFLALALIPMEF